jgi:predicted Zn-dependent peptidase
LEKDVYQAQWIAGCEAYSYHDDKRVGLSLLNNLLGGPSMNNRLSMVLREKHGLTYNVETSFQPLSDTGMFFVYLGVDEVNLDRSRDLVYRELKELRRKKMSSRQLHDLKKQIIGQIALSQDNASAQMFMLGKSLQLFRRIDTMQEVFDRINKVTASQLLEISNEILNPEKWCSLVYTGNGKK